MPLPAFVVRVSENQKLELAICVYFQAVEPAQEAHGQILVLASCASIFLFVQLSKCPLVPSYIHSFAPLNNCVDPTMNRSPDIKGTVRH